MKPSMTAREFVLARLDEEVLLTKWAAAIRARVESGTPPLLYAFIWSDHPDFDARWEIPNVSQDTNR